MYESLHICARQALNGLVEFVVPRAAGTMSPWDHCTACVTVCGKMLKEKLRNSNWIGNLLPPQYRLSQATQTKHTGQSVVCENFLRSDTGVSRDRGPRA